MRKTMIPVYCLFALVLAYAAPQAAVAQQTLFAHLRAFDEVPAIFSPAGGFFNATVSADGTSISYTLEYHNLAGNVLQSHIHIGQPGVNGGIFVFLCSNLGNGPAGTQPCPPDPATISGTITADNIIAVGNQGIPKGGLVQVLRTIKFGRAYANLHTDLYPGGEMRGQVSITSP
jgi:hypothetical protein